MPKTSSREVFLEVHRLWQSRDVSNWEATLRTLATRRAVDLLREAQGRKKDFRRKSSTFEAPLRKVWPADESVKNWFGSRSGSFPQQQAEVFSLRYLEDQSHEQIASALGISTQAVASFVAQGPRAVGSRVAKSVVSDGTVIMSDELQEPLRNVCRGHAPHQPCRPILCSAR